MTEALFRLAFLLQDASDLPTLNVWPLKRDFQLREPQLKAGPTISVVCWLASEMGLLVAQMWHKRKVTTPYY
jgi:hypothetical protein